jgi:hypothetical protein
MRTLKLIKIWYYGYIPLAKKVRDRIITDCDAYFTKTENLGI